MINQKKLALTVIGFYLVTHVVAWLGTDIDKLIYTLVPILFLAAGFFAGIKIAQKVLALICALFAVLGLSLLLRLEADFPVYLAVALYTLGSAALSWLVLRSGRSEEAGEGLRR